jgi:hypothetical protein
MQDDWVKDVWEEAYYRNELHPSPDLLRQHEEGRDQEACLVFCHKLLSFTRI